MIKWGSLEENALFIKRQCLRATAGVNVADHTVAFEHLCETVEVGAAPEWIVRYELDTTVWSFLNITVSAEYKPHSWLSCHCNSK